MLRKGPAGGVGFAGPCVAISCNVGRAASCSTVGNCGNLASSAQVGNVGDGTLVVGNCGKVLLAEPLAEERPELLDADLGITLTDLLRVVE
jgi:hypothetical protein